MEKLKKEYNKNGYRHKQIRRTDKAAIYVQYNGDRFITYNVFKIKVQQPRLAVGKEFSKKEVYPSNESYGYSAWTAYTLDRAEHILNQIELYGRKLRSNETGVIVMKLNNNRLKLIA